MIASETARPGLVVMFDAQVLALQLVEAARSRWRIIWLVDHALGDVHDSLRMLSRLGTVIDVSGCTDAECAKLLASHRPTGIIAFGEYLLLRASVIGQQLGLAANSARTIGCYTDKFRQREALQAAGVPVPGYWQVAPDLPPDSFEKLTRSITFPVIVKPKAGYGSRKTYRVEDAQALRTAIDNEARVARNDPMIIEEYLPDGWAREDQPAADFVSVESIVCDTEVTHLAITGRARLAEPFRETGSYLPADLPQPLCDEVLEVAGRAIAALGTRTGAVHTEIKLTPAGPRVIEVNGRIGGMIPELLMLSGGHSILELACRAALGERLSFDTPLPFQRIGYSFIGVPPMSASRLIGLEGMSDLKKIPGLGQITRERRNGDPVDWRDGFDGRLYIVFGAADSYQEMWAARERIGTTIRASFD